MCFVGISLIDGHWIVVKFVKSEETIYFYHNMVATPAIKEKILALCSVYIPSFDGNLHFHRQNSVRVSSHKWNVYEVVCNLGIGTCDCGPIACLSLNRLLSSTCRFLKKYTFCSNTSGADTSISSEVRFLSIEILCSLLNYCHENEMFEIEHGSRLCTNYLLSKSLCTLRFGVIRNNIDDT